MQAIGFLQFANVDGMTRDATAEQRATRARRILATYSYADIVATWDGWHDDRPGVFVVLDGNGTTIANTVDRLASGLYFLAIISEEH